MRLIEYLNRDFELLSKRIVDVSSAYDNKDPELTMSKAKAMFVAFTRRFDIEDFLLSKFCPSAAMEPLIAVYLEKRSVLRAQLEDMLSLHVSEPNFMLHVQMLKTLSDDHLQYSEHEFLPKVIEQLSEPERANLSNALEDRLHNAPLGLVSTS